MTRRRTLLAIVAAALGLALLIGIPDHRTRVRATRVGPEEDIAPAPAPRDGAPASPAARLPRLTLFPDGEPVPREDLVDDPNRIPGPDLEVRGHVFRSGSPVGDALVRLCRAYPPTREPAPSPAPFAEQRTDPDGSFSLRCARRSRLVVEVRHEGSAVRRALLVMPLAGDPEPVRIDLAPGHALDVRVIGPGGGGIAGVPVRLHCAPGAPWPVPVRWRVDQYARAGSAPGAVLETVTDSSGLATFRGVEAGAVKVEAGPVYECVFVPTGGEVVFVRETPGTVEGTLRREDGAAIPDVLLTVETSGLEDRLGTVSARTDANGRFRIEGVPPGWVVGGAIGPERRERVEGEPALLRPGAGITWNPVRKPGTVIRGRCLAGDGTPVGTARLLLFRDAEVVDIGWSGEDGQFELIAAEPGEHQVTAHTYGAAAAATVTVPGDPPEIRLRPCARVTGRVHGVDRPDVHRFTVELHAAAFDREVVLDANGRFAFEDVPPLKGAVLSPGDAEPFDVPAGAEVHVDLRRDIRCRGQDIEPDGWGRLTGQVRGPDGRPCAGAIVTFPNWGFLDMRLVQPAWANTTTSDDEGWYVLLVGPGWAGRKESVAAAGPGLAPMSRFVRMPEPGENRVIDLELPEGGEIGGRVTNPLGPVRSAYISARPVGTTGYAFPCNGYTGADGGFCFLGLAQGRYELRVFVDGGFEPAATMDVATGRTDVSIAIPAGFISGIVVRGRVPVEGSAVVAVSGSSEFVVQTGRGGRFRLSALPAGSYDIGSEKGVRITGVRTGTDDLLIRLPSE